MSDLNSRERELVAIGAAIGSNCVPCIEYHVPQARQAGLTDAEILAAIQLADRVKQVPAHKVLEVATALVQEPCGCQQPSSETTAEPCGCQQSAEEAAAAPCACQQDAHADAPVQPVAQAQPASQCC